MASPGCSKEYQQKQLDNDSARSVELRAMIRALREQAEGPDRQAVMRSQIAPELNQNQKLAEATVTQIAKADAVDLKRIERFGKKVYRASLDLTSGGKSQTLTVLLVEVDGKLRWAGRN